MNWKCSGKQYIGCGVSVSHVIPLNDLKEHDEDVCCWCNRRCDSEEEKVIVHNALDGREKFETGERLPS